MSHIVQIQTKVRDPVAIAAACQRLALADLGPVDGPMLGPFEHRSAALAAEIAWLKAHWLDSATSLD